MMSMFASLSPTAQILLAVAVIWVAGFLMTRATKVLGLPNVTGYILAGVAIGPYALDVIPHEITGGMDFMTDVALAFIAFGVGQYLRRELLAGRGGRVIVLTCMESLVTAAVVTAFTWLVFRLPLAFCLLLGAIGSATAPASSLMTIRQYKARGDFVNTLIQVVAMDDAVALLAFSVCAAVAAGTENAGNLENLLRPLLLNAAALLASYLLGRLLCTALHQRSTEHRLVLTCACIFSIAAGCAALDISPLLGCMALGCTYINVTGDKTLFKQVNRITPPINVMFFVLSGMRLNLPSLKSAGIIGVAYFLVRILGKVGGSYLGAKMTGMAENVRRYLGLALIPQAGVSIGLAVLAQRMLPPDMGALLSTIILSSSVLYEMVGPVCAREALVRAGVISRGAAPAQDADEKHGAGKTEHAKAHLKKKEQEPAQEMAGEAEQAPEKPVSHPQDPAPILAEKAPPVSAPVSEGRVIRMPEPVRTEPPEEEESTEFQPKDMDFDEAEENRRAFMQMLSR